MEVGALCVHLKHTCTRQLAMPKESSTPPGSSLPTCPYFSWSFVEVEVVKLFSRREHLSPVSQQWVICPLCPTKFNSCAAADLLP